MVCPSPPIQNERPGWPGQAVIIGRDGPLSEAIQLALRLREVPCELLDPSACRLDESALSDLLVVVDPPSGDWRASLIAPLAARGSGRIVHVSSGERPMGAGELARRGVTENLVQWTRLDGLPSAGAETQPSAIGRPVTCAEVAEAVVFLASPEAGYLVGAVLPVTGGTGLGLFPEQLK